MNSTNPSKNNNKENIIDEQSSSNKLLLKSTQTQPQSMPMNGSQLIDNRLLEKISSYQCWSIFNAFCCCFLLELTVCCYSIDTKNFKTQRNIQASKRTSKKSLTLNICSTIYKHSLHLFT